MGRRKKKLVVMPEIKRMAELTLARKKRLFVKLFSEESDEALLGYLAHCAKELGIGPRRCDVLGAQLLEERLDTWKKTLAKLGLVATPAVDRPPYMDLLSREIQQQQEVYKKIIAGMQQNEIDFAEQHQNDSDEELFEYVRAWAERLKRTPDWVEVLGGSYIKKRFNNDWRLVLRLSGLSGREDCPPKFHKRPIYRDEAKKQLDIYVDECMREIAEVMQENTAEKMIYVAPAEKAAV